MASRRSTCRCVVSPIPCAVRCVDNPPSRCAGLESVDHLLALLGGQYVACGREELNAVVFGRIVARRHLEGARGGVFTHQDADGRRGCHVGIQHRASSRQQCGADRIHQHAPGTATVSCQDQGAGRLPGRIGTREPRCQFRRQVFANDTPQPGYADDQLAHTTAPARDTRGYSADYVADRA